MPTQRAMLTRRSVLTGLLGAVAVPGYARAGVATGGGLAFGSSWRITVGAGTPLAPLQARIDAVISRVDRQMSPYRPESDLSRFNATRTSHWQPMPHAICEVAARALRIAALTGGAFDPTVGPLVSRLGFGPIEGRAGHYSGLSARATGLRKAAPDLTLDLCGIAKGYALDRVIADVRRAGISDALVEIGGEVRALGRHPSGRDWRVAISNPAPGGVAARCVIAPGPLALATSGHAVNGASGPVATSHIIDPERGAAASSALLSVSVLAPDATEADALATALCALGPEAGVRLAQERGISALFLRDPADGAPEVMTGRFRQHIPS